MVPCVPARHQNRPGVTATVEPVQAWRRERTVPFPFGLRWAGSDTARETIAMTLRLLIVIAILVLAVALLAGYMRRLFRRSREVEKRIDYSKMREWKDDD